MCDLARLQVDGKAGPSSGKEVKEGTMKKQHKNAEDEVSAVQCCDLGRLQLLVRGGFSWRRRRTALIRGDLCGLRCMLCCVSSEGKPFKGFLRREALQGLLVLHLAACGLHRRW